MALNSINTNIAAYSAQGNIGRASDSASASVSRLSSGNRIVRASDDVAALSVGTSLRTTVSTLKVALTNSSQATSLLQVADAGLSQIAEILQRQKAIAVQANSGTLSATERSYLNQEFQSLRSQIDQIATSSSFSAVKLLDGSLAGAIGLSTNALDNIDITANPRITTGNVFALTGVGVNNDVLSVNGFEFTLTTSTVGTAAADGKVRVGATATETAANIAAFLNSSSDARLANYTFSNTGANVTVAWGGGEITAAQTVTASTVTGTAATYGAANGTLAIANSVDGLGLDRVRALGSASGSLLLNGDTAATNAGSAIATRDIINNADFIGKIGEGNVGLITGTYANVADTVAFSIKVGDITYSTTAGDISNAATVALTFTGADQYGNAAGGSFVLNLRGGAITAASINSQADVDSVVAELNAGLSGITFTQNRDITTFTDGEVVVVGGEQVANLNNAQVNFRSSDFTSVNIESVKITAPNIGSTDARFEVVINGETFISTAGIGAQIDTNDIVALQSQSDPTKVLSIVFGGTGIASAAGTVADLGTQEKANAVAAALEKAFGLDNAGSKLSFQVGVTSTETIGVKIASVKADSLYSGQNLDISTQLGAQAAADVIDAALVNVTRVRADVGALQSRLGFTSANLQTSVQNQDAARGVLLDTDVAAESTSYATSQVQLQAGISVLAQANLFTQNLLKLIG